MDINEWFNLLNSIDSSRILLQMSRARVLPVRTTRRFRQLAHCPGFFKTARTPVIATGVTQIVDASPGRRSHQARQPSLVYSMYAAVRSAASTPR